MASPDNTTAGPAPRLPAAQRREQLALAAAARFHQLGYHRVSLADVAREVGVTGPAVYRHFRSKQALLAEAISLGLDQVEDALARTADGSLDDMVASVADIGLDRPDLWVLVQRESKFLDLESGAKVQRQFSRVADGFVDRLLRDRPTLTRGTARLLVAAATAALSSPSVSRTTLPRTVYRRELTEAALAALRVDLDNAPAHHPPAPTESKRPEPVDSRREEVVDKAIDLFFRLGYAAVTLDDIGAAVGMAGPSLYHHFPTKADILVAALDRATAQLAAAQRRRAEQEREPGLDELITSYTDFCLRNRALVGIYVSESGNLPPSVRNQTIAVLREGMRQWTTAARTQDSRLYEAVARVRVHAALAAVHDVVRLGQLYTRPRIAEEIDAILYAILARGARD
ncbi:TetR/AcrR family transcriptional regulator [Streptomyces sp. NPDC057199]|uniref:TetR/AcrR family transcriptional regulator n=1 Tax=Streptomyces sp. NPDC057199 TaxID=3346047 RepID=UPI0036459F5B